MTIAALWMLWSCGGSDEPTTPSPSPSPTTPTEPTGTDPTAQPTGTTATGSTAGTAGTGSTATTATTGRTGDTGPHLDPRTEVTLALIDGFVLPTTDDLIAKTDAFAAAASLFCKAPTPKNFTAVREAWWAARGPWKRLELVNFGPMTEEPWRIGPKLDFWPGRPSSVEAYLATTAGVTVSDFDLMGGATRGFPALEIVLYDGTDPYTALVSDPRRCDYVVGGSADTAVLARRFHEAWTTDWRDRLVAPELHKDDDYELPQEVLDEWVNRLVFTVEDLRFEKLGKPFGDDSGGSPLPDTMESRYSGRALTDAHDALLGVHDAFHGLPAGTGIAALLAADHAELITDFDEAFAAADAALLAIPETLEVSIYDHRDTIFDAQNALRDLQVVLQVDVAQALDVTIVFNDNDGD